MDIQRLLYRIKENIKLIEAGADSSPLLYETHTLFLELLELIKLFLISERDSYYGYFLMNMQFRVNFGSDGIAGIKLNEFPPVLESNPLLLCKFTLKEIIYVVCHEIDHIVLNHPAEMIKSNPTKNEQKFFEFNLAADASVNDRINHEIITEKHNFMSAPDGLITSGSLAKMFRLSNVSPLESYAYYLSLISGQAGANGKGLSYNGKNSIMQQNNQNAPGEQDAVSQSTDGNGSVGNNTVVTTATCNRFSDHNWEVGSDADDAAAAVRELVNAAAGMMSEESRGLMPAYFMSQVELLNKPPELSWQAILKKYIGTISSNKLKTRTRLNRRQPERFDVPGRIDDKVLKIVVAIDTSGSVDDHMIAQIFDEIFAILAKRKHELTVIECDAEVQRVYKAKTPADIQTKVAGRGGTLFRPVIEYVNNDKYFRDALLIYFTDGFGEYEIPKPRTYRNIWVVFDNTKHLSVKEPYGIVLKL